VEGGLAEPESRGRALQLSRHLISARRFVLPGVGVAVAPVLALEAYHRPPIGIDFHTYVAAAMIGAQAGWSRIYDQEVVAVAQKALVPNERAQPFLSPPPVAWVAAPFQALPYAVAFDLWAVLMLGAIVCALAWTTTYRGSARIAAVGVALVPWWIWQALMVGQVVPLVAVSLLVAWRLLRDDRDIAAGLVLAVILLKPNTALLAPLALLVSGRVRAFGAWLLLAAAIVAASALALGPHGIAAYTAGLSHLPTGANNLTLGGTFGLAGTLATAVRAVIVVGALVTAFRFRAHPGLVLAVGAIASLTVAPYLHASDLCVLVAAGWMIWHELREPFARALLIVGVALSTPLYVVATVGLPINRWLVFELLLLITLGVMAWLPSVQFGDERDPRLLTGRADFRKQAPA